MVAKVVAIILMMGALSSCGVKVVSDKPRPGAFCKDRYYDHKGWFSVAIPKSHRQKSQGRVTETTSSMTFYDMVGGLVRFDVTEIPEELFSQFCLAACASGGTVQLFQALFDHHVEFEVKVLFPTTTVTDEEVIKFPQGEKGFFAVVHIPEGGTIQNLETGVIADSTRGYLIFMDDRQLVMMSIQKSPIADEFRKEHNLPDLHAPDLLLRELLAFKEGYRNEWSLSHPEP